jgi:hypothetical protein
MDATRDEEGAARGADAVVHDADDEGVCDFVCPSQLASGIGNVGDVPGQT